MTLVAGFPCKEGLLVCADLEESKGFTGKRRVEKLFVTDLWSECIVVIGGAGSSALIDNAVRRVRKVLGVIKSGDPYQVDSDHVLGKVEDVLREMQEKYWIDRSRPFDLSLLVGTLAQGDTELFTTHDLVPQPHVGCACIGIGEELATYLADRLYTYWCSEEEMVRIASFIFKEAKESSQSVGLGTEMYFLPKGTAKFRKYSDFEIKQIESALPDFFLCLDDFKKKLVSRPQSDH